MQFKSSLGTLAVICLLLGIYTLTAVEQGKNRSVYLVNGLEESYQVTVGDKFLTLPPLSSSLVKLPEGEYVVAADHPKVEDVTVKLETPFWSRPLNRVSYVINPDELGILLMEEIEYLTDPSHSEADTLKAEVHCNQHLYEFNNIDYMFRETPEELRMDGDRDVKSTLVVVKGVAVPELMSALVQRKSSREAQRWAARKFHVSGFGFDTMLGYIGIASSEAGLKLLQEHSPTEEEWLNWHLWNTQLLGTLEPDRDLYSEYLAKKEEESKRGDYFYILSTLTLDPAKVEKYLKASMESEQPSESGFRAYVVWLRDSGHFEKALGVAEEGLKRFPESPLVGEQVLCLMMLGRKKEALETLKVAQEKSPKDFELLGFEVRIRSELGEFEWLGKLLEEREKAGEFIPEEWRYLLAEGLEDSKELKRLSNEYRASAFLVSLKDRKPQEAFSMASERKDYASVAVLAWATGDEETYKEAQEAFWTALSSGNFRDRALAKGRKSLSAESFMLSPSLNSSRLFLTLVAIERPELRPKLVPLAKKLNQRKQTLGAVLSLALEKLSSEKES